MTEATVTQDLHTVLKLRFPAFDVAKVSDRFTKGRPDSAVTGNGRTTFLEIKLLKPGDSYATCSDPLQRHTLKKLWRASGGRAFYVVYDARQNLRWVLIYEPSQLGDPVKVEAEGPGFDHGIVADLIARLHEVSDVSSDGRRASRSAEPLAASPETSTSRPRVRRASRAPQRRGSSVPCP